MKVANETYICERCEREVNPMHGSCDDLECPLFDPRYEEEEEDECQERGV